jgi:hypothetical protein
VHNERRSVIHSYALFQRLEHPGDLEQSARLILRNNSALKVNRNSERGYCNNRGKLEQFGSHLSLRL